MTTQTLIAAFEEAAETGRLVCRGRQYRVDCDTAFSLFARLKVRFAPAGKSSFLLESTEGGETWARYSFLGLGALLEVLGYQDRVELVSSDGTSTLEPGLDKLREVLRRWAPIAPSDLEGRFQGGLVGYIAYDAVRTFEKIPDSNPDPSARLFRFVLPEVLCIFDNFRQGLRVIAFAETGHLTPADAALAATSLVARQDELETALLSEDSLGALPRCIRVPEDPGGAAAKLSSSFSKSAFIDAVERAKDYILAGDIFQVVVSQRLEATGVEVEPITVYRRLRHQNPSPYLFFLGYPDETLIGASPEVMVRLTGRRAEVRPIAGTRPRGADEAEDTALERDLLADPKEIAEHVMLLDLGRNDLGRVCEIGSIEIPERMVIERYSKVMHVVSHVKGRLNEGVDWLDLLGATFPAGTLSGAPKIRAMEIIDELEPTRRELYGGAIGYIGFDGNMDLCITIRTLHARGDSFVVQAGAGIVADSVPATEFEESVNKALAVLQAIGAGPLD